jgi:hypothetical protein
MTLESWAWVAVAVVAATFFAVVKFRLTVCRKYYKSFGYECGHFLLKRLGRHEWVTVHRIVGPICRATGVPYREHECNYYPEER